MKNRNGGQGQMEAETTAAAMETEARYNRVAAARYALRYYDAPNPEYTNNDTVGDGGDCANFVSQSLFAGGRPMDYRESAEGKEWWYRRRGDDNFDADHDDWWSCSWTVAHSLYEYLRANGGRALNVFANPRLARTLRYGDVIFYDWDGDNRANHSVVVTGFNRRGYPLVTFRTRLPRRPRRNAYWTLHTYRRARAIVALRLPDENTDYGVAADFDRLSPCDRTRG